MKRVRQLASIVLALLMLISVITVAPINANATESGKNPTGYTLLNESQFATKLNELKSSYPEKSTPNYTYYENGTALAWTCKGFANKLAYYCFGSSQYTSNGGWTKSYDKSSFNAGDIVSVNNDGHTIFITYVNGSTIRYAEGNFTWEGEGYYGAVRWDVQISLSELQGKFTFKHHLNGNNLTGGGSPTSTPTPTVGDNKNYVMVNEEITFWYSGLSECSKAEFYFEDGNGKKYYTKDSTSSRFFDTYFEKEGLYRVYVGGLYNGKWYYSQKITVYVFDPVLSVNKTTVDVNEEITFVYSGLSACQQVKICFEKNGTTYYSGDSTSSRTYKNYFINPGEYYVYAEGKVNDYKICSNKIKIIVNPKIEPSSHSESQPTQPSSSETQSTESTQTTSSTEDTQATQTTEPTDVTQSTEPTTPTEVTQPTQSTQATQATQTQATEPVETITTETQGTQATEPTQPASQTQATEPTTEAKTSISVKAAKTSIYVGDTTTVNATVENPNGATTFTSSNTKVATVSSKGVVKGLKAGSVTIIAKNNGKSDSVKITVKQKANTISVKAAAKTVKYATVKKKAVTVSAITVKKAKGVVTYKKASGSAKVTVNKKNGKLTVKKGTKKGTYTVKVKVTAAGNTTYKAGSKIVTVKINVK